MNRIICLGCRESMLPLCAKCECAALTADRDRLKAALDRLTKAAVEMNQKWKRHLGVMHADTSEEQREFDAALSAVRRDECRHGRADLSKPCPACPAGTRFAEAAGPCACGNSDCRGVTDNENHQCGGPREACALPGCPECNPKPQPPTPTRGEHE